ncbi:hypothetical protein NQT66_05030 [Cellulophaga baltica]|uniref:hypothetical protein n=1 Tax=Cellulophaga baltica TaxID=76594 RepID=UPI002148FC2D|nr:hypothetical protein [Cellulophaga baltica]MCR1024158.1 hypothetical protein [Cellulophaga baltica]
MNQIHRIKILLLLFPFFILSCKKSNKQINIDVSGLWSWEYVDNSKAHMNKVFTLDLIQRGSVVEGKYCAIAKNNKIIDCYKNDNLKGIIIKDTVHINFNGFYDSESSGKAILYKKGDNLVWQITSTIGDVYAPKYAELYYGKLKENKTEEKNSTKVSTCDYGNNCSCIENKSGKSLYEDSLIITCVFKEQTLEDVYSSVYNSQEDLQEFMTEKLPNESHLYSDNATFSTDYKITSDSISVYISQENGGFEFLLKKKGNTIVFEKHAFAG